MLLDDFDLLHVLGREILGQQRIAAAEQIHTLHVEIANGLPVVVDVPTLAHLHPGHPLEHVRDALVLLLDETLHVELHRIAEQIDLRGPHEYLVEYQCLRLQLDFDVPPVRDTIPVRYQGQCHRSVAQHRHPYRIPGSRHPAYLQLEAPLHVRQRVLRTILPCRHIQHHRSSHRRSFPGFHHHTAYPVAIIVCCLLLPGISICRQFLRPRLIAQTYREQ